MDNKNMLNDKELGKVVGGDLWDPFKMRYTRNDDEKGDPSGNMIRVKSCPNCKASFDDVGGLEPSQPCPNCGTILGDGDDGWHILQH